MAEEAMEEANLEAEDMAKEAQGQPTQARKRSTSSTLMEVGSNNKAPHSIR